MYIKGLEPKNIDYLVSKAGKVDVESELEKKLWALDNTTKYVELKLNEFKSKQSIEHILKNLKVDKGPYYLVNKFNDSGRVYVYMVDLIQPITNIDYIPVNLNTALRFTLYNNKVTKVDTVTNVSNIHSILLPEVEGYEGLGTITILLEYVNELYDKIQGTLKL